MRHELRDKKHTRISTVRSLRNSARKEWKGQEVGPETRKRNKSLTTVGW